MSTLTVSSVLLAALHFRQLGMRQSQRQKGRAQRCGRPPAPPFKRRQMLAGQRYHCRNSARARSVRRRRPGTPRATFPRLPACPSACSTGRGAVLRQETQQAGDRLRAAGIAGQFRGPGGRLRPSTIATAGSSPTPSRRDNLRGRHASASDRRRDRISAPRDVPERLARQAAALDGREQRRRHRMPCPGAGILRRDDVAPPLQADLARQRLADAVANARDLGVEGIEGEEVGPPVLRREEGGKLAVPVGGPHEFHQRPRAAPLQSMATSAAATARSSASSTL